MNGKYNYLKLWINNGQWIDLKKIKCTFSLFYDSKNIIVHQLIIEYHKTLKKYKKRINKLQKKVDLNPWHEDCKKRLLFKTLTNLMSPKRKVY